MADSGWSVDGQAVPLGDDYTDTVTHLRIFDEGDGWALDGADDSGNYTPAVWKYDTFEQAWARTEEFAEFLANEGYTILPREGRKKSPTPKATRPGEEDYCYTCERVTIWDGEFCTGCGRQWGYEHAPEKEE